MADVHICCVCSRCLFLWHQMRDVNSVCLPSTTPLLSTVALPFRVWISLCLMIAKCVCVCMLSSCQMTLIRSPRQNSYRPEPTTSSSCWVSTWPGKKPINKRGRWDALFFYVCCTDPATWEPNTNGVKAGRRVLGGRGFSAGVMLEDVAFRSGRACLGSPWSVFECGWWWTLDLNV